ncbi:polysaccharide pyruvyl transferase family protein [Pontimonas sp.]|uniref:polysaccharide pyruvyl transferase family protein n=1 Tax=Pontimonas sp. TaxID=2304492 RepID=UPI00286FD78E|nr:polysaccharide pyruvyl transferase family protein [Pontimonas sp.]MDR9434215.1 polysaccharide pyruvyl transferase family protein [Pontimonas sp.]
MAQNRGTIVVLNDTAAIAHYGCKVVMKRIVDEVAAAGFEVKTVSVYSTWRVHQKLIDQAAAVIVNGEGTLHHSAQRAQTLVAVAPYCAARGIPVFLINSVWQDNSADMARQAEDFLLRFVRESRSEKQFAAAGLKAKTVPDLTLGWNYRAAKPAPQRSGRVYTDAVGMPATDLLYRLFREDAGSRYVTMTPPGGHRGDYSDYDFERLPAPFDRTFPLTLRLRLRQIMKRTLLIRGKTKNAIRRMKGHLEMVPLEGFMAALESSELVVTGRFHGVCLCLLTGTPFLALTSNSHKVEGMLEDAGLAHRIVRPADVRAVLAHPPEWSEDDAKKAKAFVQKARRGQKAMFASVLSMAKTESS